MMKVLNMPMEIERHEDLEVIQKYYSDKSGVKLSKAQTVKRLLFETANQIRSGKGDASESDK